MLKISFILPCYNVEAYIKDCLDSIYAQDIQQDEFEVICVNDCATDNSRSIIVEYAKKRSNLKLLDHKYNLTVGGARNTGILGAKGEYIWFIDPDDTIKTKSAKVLWKISTENNFDVLFFNFDDFDEKMRVIRLDRTFPITRDVYSGQEYVARFFPGKMNTFGIVWRCLFRTKFLFDEGLRYPLMCKAEDVVFLWEVLLHAKRVGSVEDAYYNYRCNPHSVINKQAEAKVAFSDRVLRGYLIERMLQNYDNALLPVVRCDMTQTVRWCANSNIELLSKMSKSELNLYYNEIIVNRTAINSIWTYMNRKSKLLFNTTFGKLFWVIKVFLLCKISNFMKFYL